MRSRNSTILRLSILAGCVLVASLSGVAAPKIAVLSPDGTETSRRVADELSQSLDGKLAIVDSDLAASAYRSQAIADPFNMSTDVAKGLGTAIGSDLLLIVRAVVQRRTSFERGEYFEAYAVMYLVSSRTGHLLLWDLKKAEAAKAAEAEKQMLHSAAVLGTSISQRAVAAMKLEIGIPPVPDLEQPPIPSSPLAKNFKAPIPFRRIKPDYTALAAFYEVAATVDMIIDLNANGEVLRTEVVRWAGYGLDESVEKAVREMKWRPAERDGRFLPMRFLVRYNFKKIDRD